MAPALLERKQLLKGHRDPHTGHAEVNALEAAARNIQRELSDLAGVDSCGLRLSKLGHGLITFLS